MMLKAKTHLSSMYGSMARDPGQWEPGDKPAMNSWYPCKRGDDYWKIILWSRATDTQTARYKVVSMRGADIGFDLTLAMARAMLMNGTRRM